ncbi:YolD-like family protein [Paludifilum halophilum]|uniref:YolD-like family protein n=1 Tax=Paludifilum halophilum TaxID=1642702 RepID=A0A235BAY6_9BACL|nr:YolD-like family protein [Paludifilum halophilum]OYD09464.1 hypothetical protein CHM34_00095 [Paludifilum halophilum]
MDRGNKLWEGHRMILPEHVEQYQESRQKQFVPPVLDEQQMEELNRTVRYAKESDRRLRWRVYNDQGPYEVEGRVGRIRPVQGWVEVIADGGRIRIWISRLLDVQPI